VLERRECHLLPCGRCGRVSTAITIHRVPRITVVRCWKCERRSWTVEGADASIAEVLVVLRHDARHAPEPGPVAGT
jgi:hypothetical protein